MNAKNDRKEIGMAVIGTGTIGKIRTVFVGITPGRVDRRLRHRRICRLKGRQGDPGRFLTIKENPALTCGNDGEAAD